MRRRLITAIIAVAFFIESTGVEFSNPAARTKEYALRPLALAVSHDTAIPSISQKASSAGSRAEELNLILEEHRELDTTEKFLVYIKKHKPHLLDAISKEKQLQFLRDFMFLGYETVPLPKEVLECIADPEMGTGARIAEIRKARGMEPEDILARISEKVKKGISRSKEAIDKATYSDIERGIGGHALCQLFDIARELKADMIYIMDGRDWNRASAGLPDHNKMKLCRLRKGWTQTECAIGLENAGLDFGKKSIARKADWVSTCERGKWLPTLNEVAVIKRVFCNQGLFKEVTEQRGVPGAAWKVDHAKVDRAEAPAAKEKGWKFLDGIPRKKIHLFLAEHWQEVAGKTPAEIEREYGVPAESTRKFLKNNPAAVELYDVKFPAKRWKSRETQKKLREEFLFLGYETRPLKEEVLEKLPGIKHAGRRIAEIREARGKQPKEVSTNAEIPSDTYYTIERRKKPPYPENLHKVSRELEVDPILIIDGRSWPEVAAELKDKDCEKMRLRRERKGLTREGFVTELKKAGLEFTVKTAPAENSRIRSIELGETTPNLKEIDAVGKVLGDDTLFEEVKKKLEAEAKEAGQTAASLAAKLIRTEELNRILEKNPELDTVAKLLEYLKRHKPKLLKDIPKERRPEFLKEFLFLGYETRPLKEEVLEKLPGIKHAGRRIAEIREARGKTPKEVSTNAEIPSPTYYTIEYNENPPDTKNLYKVSRELEVDPILIIDGRSWPEVAAELKDKDYEKMRLCRERKGLTREGFVTELKKVGLEFTVKTAPAENSRIRSIELGETTPNLKEIDAVGKVLGDDTLFEEVKKILEAEAKEAEEETEETTETKGPKRKRLRFPGDKRASDLPQLFAEYGEQIIGMTINQIAALLDKPPSTIRNFLWGNPSFVASFSVAMQKRGRPRKGKAAPVSLRVGTEEPGITAGEATDMAAADMAAEESEEAETAKETKEAAKAEAPEEEGPRFFPGTRRKTEIVCFFANNWREVKGLTVSEIVRRFKKPKESIKGFLRQHRGAAEFYGVAIGRKGKPSTAVAGAGKPTITPEEMADIEAAAEATKKRETTKARRETAESIQLKATAGGPEVDYAIFEAEEILECLRSVKDRGLVEAWDIEDAIAELEYACERLWAEFEGLTKTKKQAKSEAIGDILIHATVLKRRLKALVSTELCDWDNPQIRPKAAEITETSTTDSDRKDAIVKWVDGNIKLVPEYDGCWNTKASQTPGLLKGTHFNRVNLIVAMLRSIGIPAGYRIISFKKEMAVDKLSAGRDVTAERVVAEALICVEEGWNDILSKTFRKYKSVCLEAINAKKITVSYRLDNIDDFAREKARGLSRKAQDIVSPSQQLRALKAIHQAA